MKHHSWFQGFPGAIIVSDANGILIELNAKAAEGLAKDGGDKLIGSNIFDCHPEPAQTKLKELYKTCQTNVYTIEKNGTKKLIYQTPWYHEGQFAGYIELSLEIPFELPHFIRD
jgi:transcriptional regulator with PAS, ATPase and Fis domain